MVRLIFSLLCMFVFVCNAQERFSFTQLKGKRIVLPTYNDGDRILSFVYEKETFYTRKFSKSKKIENLNVLGCPITIKDITISDVKKKSQKLCVLFSLDNVEYTMAIPMKFDLLGQDNSKELMLIKNMFYINNPSRRFYDRVINSTVNYCYFVESDFSIACYDAEAIERLENLKSSRRKFRCDKMGPNEHSISRIFFKGIINSFDVDKLYVEMSDELGMEIREVIPLFVDGTQKGYSKGSIVIDVEKDLPK